ncbi:hypothetical protein H310_11990 [Aphanomyces invadans]|uniref:Uncharacterized protein n=1 Tax=Aphanomyces invadans TaxID=157072 RepID=A0A024TLZ4_9STRA|nr:hypothetical protein H310_11990 [Aphanomyces invadans]ETV94347.1 hypothetical protein H310_11990 [Aphanomyces invadans]|eukprot:XP_008877109.1 hypothetical protein H310_11990 [Aphanomyces invadans]
MHPHGSPPRTTWERSTPQPETIVTSFRGLCLYKTGKCTNERALKTNGQAHNLCNMHRIKQNHNQRKMDSKARCQRGHYRPRTLSPTRQDATLSPTQTPPHHRFVHGVGAPSPSWHPQHHHHARFGHNPDSPGHVDSTVYSDDDDKITIPTPAFLKGEAREAFRSRVLQKLLVIISEEVGSLSAPPPPPSPRARPPSSFTAYSHPHDTPHPTPFCPHQRPPPLPALPHESIHEHPHHNYSYDVVQHECDDHGAPFDRRPVLPPLSAFHAPLPAEYFRAKSI